MASFPDHEISFVSGKSTRSSSNRPRSQRGGGAYVSPFVIEANRRAKERVRQRMSSYNQAYPRRASPPPTTKSHDSGEWNMSVQTPGLFDPKLRKQEIFRLGPNTTTTSRKENRRPETNSHTDDDFRTHKYTVGSDRAAPRMTLRTQGNLPRRTNINQDQRGQSRSNSPTDRNSEPENTQRASSGMQPKPSSDVHPHQRVTRSTSPIDDRVMQDIYQTDQRHPQASHFSMRRNNHHRDSQDSEGSDSERKPAPRRHTHAQQSPVFQQFMRDHGRRQEAMDPQSVRDHYGNMIRDRLRQLLQQHREGKPAGEDSEADPAMKPYPYFSRLRRQTATGSGVLGGYLRPADMVDTQMMTRDLMASMAQIMTAVGEIVTNQQQNQQKNRRKSRKDWYKEHPVPSSSSSAPSSAANGSRTSSNLTQPQTTPSIVSGARVKNPLKAPTSLSELAALSAARGIAQQREKEAQAATATATATATAGSAAVGNTGKNPHRQEFMWDMAQALRPDVMLQEAVAAAEHGDVHPADIPLPKNKAAVFDMIFSKLQAIETCERDLISYLQEPRDIPVASVGDVIVNDLKQRQRRKPSTAPSSSSSTAATNHYSNNNLRGTQTQTHAEENDDMIPPPPVLTPHSRTVNQAKTAADATFDFLKRYPSLGTISSCLRSDFEEYKMKLDRARNMRDAVFVKKRTDLATSADTVADAICDRIIGSVASEIGGFVEDYSKNYVGKL